MPTAETSPEIGADLRYCQVQATLVCRGAWTMPALAALEQKVSRFLDASCQVSFLDCKEITALDTGGALLLQQLEQGLAHKDSSFEVRACAPKIETLRQLVAQYVTPSPTHAAASVGFLASIGVSAYQKWRELLGFVRFLGQFVVMLLMSVPGSRRLDIKSWWDTLDASGPKALPIVLLLNFLVGVVMTYQVASQLQLYGANIYVVDIVGMIILREFGVLITSIIIAGRTSTAFAAEIGTMKINEELDALATMGVSPFLRMVMPKILALLLALPLLTVAADAFGVLGAMMMAYFKLGISGVVFLKRFQNSIPVGHYLVGMAKAPFFAFIIALVGCYRGFQVAGSAESIGVNTTKSAVQSIFLIIVLDALFSVLFSIWGV